MSSLALSAGPQAAPDHRDRIIKSLEEDNRDLQQQVSDARRELESQRSESSRAVAELRRQLSPLYQALRLVFGEIDRITPEGSSEIGGQPRTANSEKWESWKGKLGGKAAEFISELLIHGEMTGQQLKVATKCGQQTVYDTIAKLNKAQLLNKNGGKYSLKES